VWGWNEDETGPHNFLIDFGVSVTVESLGDSNWDFDVGGSQLYMSREIWDFRVSSNPTVADSWSAGMMFVELVRHKKYPFTFKHMLTLKQLLDLGEEHLGIVGDPKEIAEFNKEKRKEVFDKIEPVARDLLDKLLEIDPEKRITITEALNHPYFKQVATPPRNKT
jgi:serine/threonine protein kinase